MAELEAVAEDGDLIGVTYGERVIVAGQPRGVRTGAFARYTVAGQTMTRVIEQQKSGRQVDQQFLDLVNRKVQLLHADRASILSDAGYAHDVVSRIERSKVLSGVQYGKPVMAQWPVDGNGVLATIARTDDPPEPVVLLPALTIRRLGPADQQLVLLGTSERSDAVIAALIPRRPDESGNHIVSVWVLDGDAPFFSGDATVRVTMPDGSARMLVAAGRPVARTS